VPQRPNEFDEVQYLLQQALRVIRDGPPRELETEKMWTNIYALVSDAVDIIVNYAYVPSSDPRGGIPSPASPGRGVGGGAARSRQDVRPSQMTFAADLDLLKK
jgi:hypothetical protein